jgi:hypothetical protein
MTSEDLSYYANEKLWEAVETLCVNHGDIRVRLRAAIPSLMMVPLSNLPSGLRKRLAVVTVRLAPRPFEPGGRPSLSAAVRGMRDGTGERLARIILSVAREMSASLRDG